MWAETRPIERLLKEYGVSPHLTMEPVMLFAGQQLLLQLNRWKTLTTTVRKIGTIMSNSSHAAMLAKVQGASQ
jgi:hypothetical protein